MTTEVFISFDMIHQKGESWINYYEIHWVRNSSGLLICIDDARAVNFTTANRVGQFLDTEPSSFGYSPEDFKSRDKQAGAKYQHIYRCGMKGYDKVAL